MRVEIFDFELSIDDSVIAESPGEIRRQVQEYQRGDRRSFDLTVDVPDSFTGRVMDAMCPIPYGETRTYGDLAERLDTAPRAVGGGCGRNPVPLVVPCHRVVGSDGSLRGYSAEGGVALKRRLLDFEKRHSLGVEKRHAFGVEGRTATR